MPRGGGIEDADDFILNEAEPLGAAAAVAILQQHLLRGRARRDHLGLEQLRQRLAKHVFAAGMLFSEGINRRGDPRGIETVIRTRAVLSHYAVHGLPDNGRRRGCHGRLYGNSGSMLDSDPFWQSCARRAASAVCIFSLRRDITY